MIEIVLIAVAAVAVVYILWRLLVDWLHGRLDEVTPYIRSTKEQPARRPFNVALLYACVVPGVVGIRGGDLSVTRCGSPVRFVIIMEPWARYGPLEWYARHRVSRGLGREFPGLPVKINATLL